MADVVAAGIEADCGRPAPVVTTASAVVTDGETAWGWTDHVHTQPVVAGASEQTMLTPEQARISVQVPQIQPAHQLGSRTNARGTHVPGPYQCIANPRDCTHRPAFSGWRDPSSWSPVQDHPAKCHSPKQGRRQQGTDPPPGPYRSRKQHTSIRRSGRSH